MGAKISKKNSKMAVDRSIIMADGGSFYNLITQIDSKKIKKCQYCNKIKLLAEKTSVCVGCLNLKFIGKFKLKEVGITLTNLNEFTFIELYIKMKDANIPIIGLTNIEEYRDLVRLILN